jgi:predicted methyltransferase
MNKTTSVLLFAGLLVSASSCKKDDAQPRPAPKVAENVAPDPAKVEADAKATAEAEKKRKQAEDVARELKELEAKTAAEAARWTPELKKKAAALGDKKWKSAKEALTAILASEHRRPDHPARDAHRHPLETLTFFGIKPNQTVIEMGAGEGWYTEILAPLLARQGKLIVVSRDPAGPADEMSSVYGKRVAAMVATAPEVFGKMQVSVVAPPEKLELAAPGTADLVLAAREMHGWQRRGQMDAFLAAIHAALKDGGTFAVEQHRAAAGAQPDESVKKGYLPEAWVIEQVEAAGFKLAGKSEINANPKDTKDHVEGVWMLPPNFEKVAEADKAKYAEIGESDRMTLKFTKVAKPAAAPADAKL